MNLLLYIFLPYYRNLCRNFFSKIDNWLLLAGLWITLTPLLFLFLIDFSHLMSQEALLLKNIPIIVKPNLDSEKQGFLPNDIIELTNHPLIDSIYILENTPLFIAKKHKKTPFLGQIFTPLKGNFFEKSFSIKKQNDFPLLIISPILNINDQELYTYILINPFDSEKIFKKPLPSYKKANFYIDVLNRDNLILLQNKKPQQFKFYHWLAIFPSQKVNIFSLLDHLKKQFPLLSFFSMNYRNTNLLKSFDWEKRIFYIVIGIILIFLLASLQIFAFLILNQQQQLILLFRLFGATKKKILSLLTIKYTTITFIGIILGGCLSFICIQLFLIFVPHISEMTISSSTYFDLLKLWKKSTLFVMTLNLTFSFIFINLGLHFFSKKDIRGLRYESFH